MKIRMTFGEYGDPNQMPTLLAAVDEYTEEEWGKIPGFYHEEIAKADAKSVRECVVDIPDEEVLALWSGVIKASISSDASTGERK